MAVAVPVLFGAAAELAPFAAGYGADHATNGVLTDAMQLVFGRPPAGCGYLDAWRDRKFSLMEAYRGDEQGFFAAQTRLVQSVHDIANAAGVTLKGKKSGRLDLGVKRLPASGSFQCDSGGLFGRAVISVPDNHGLILAGRPDLLDPTEINRLLPQYTVEEIETATDGKKVEIRDALEACTAFDVARTLTKNRSMVARVFSRAVIFGGFSLLVAALTKPLAAAIFAAIGLATLSQPVILAILLGIAITTILVGFIALKLAQRNSQYSKDQNAFNALAAFIGNRDQYEQATGHVLTRLRAEQDKQARSFGSRLKLVFRPGETETRGFLDRANDFMTTPSHAKRIAARERLRERTLASWATAS